MPSYLYLIFLVIGAGLIWWSGTELVLYVDAVAIKYQLSRAFIGIVLLGMITSIPEITLTIVTSLLGNAKMAVSNLLGGISLQTAALALADLILLKYAITFYSHKAVILMACILLIFQLAEIIFFIIIKHSIGFYDFGLFGMINLFIYALILFSLKKYEERGSWVPSDLPKMPKKIEHRKEKASIQKLVFFISMHGLFVSLGGIAVGYSADKLTHIYHFDSTFIGATFVAFVTSLPEITTTYRAIHMGAYTLAISNIIGSNSLMAGLVSLADFFYWKGDLLSQLGNREIFLAALAILIHCVLLWGLLRRRKKTFFRVSLSSSIILLLQASGLVLLYFLKFSATTAA